MRPVISAFALLFAAGVTFACNGIGTTGDELVAFSAFAAGAAGAGDAFESNGYMIQLTYAQMYVGAVYVDEAPASSGGTFNTPTCISTGVYCAQVPGGLELDLLNNTPQPFSVQGFGSADLGLSWEIYLVDGDVNAPVNTGFGIPNTADLIGTATREADGAVFNWAATITINASNRGKPATAPGQPGVNPICKQRILELADISLTLSPGASMLLTIDPRGWFKQAIDFSSLPPVGMSQCQGDQNSMYGDATVCIPDSSNLEGGELGSQQGQTLFTGIFTAGSAAYTLSYPPAP